MRNFRPFIREFLIFLFVIIIFISIIACGDYIQIDIRPHLISYFLLLFIILAIFYSFKRIIRDGIASIVDCIFKTTCETKATFLEVYPCVGSTFTDRYTNEGTRFWREETRYKYIFDGNKKKILLQSVVLFDVVPSKKYHIKYGKYSKIILSIQVD